MSDDDHDNAAASADMEQIFGDDLSEVSDLPSDFFSSDNEERKAAATAGAPSAVATEKKKKLTKKVAKKKPVTSGAGGSDSDDAAPTGADEADVDNEDAHDNNDDQNDDDDDSDDDDAVTRKESKRRRIKSAEKPRKKRVKSERPTKRRVDHNDPSVPLTEAEKRVKTALDQFDSLLDSLKTGKRKAHMDEDQMDDIARQLKDTMVSAWYKDADDVRNGKPATAKLRLLPVVQDHLSKSAYHEIYMDQGVLEAMKLWLEPLEDATLVTKSIRQTLLEILTAMQVTTDHLRESKIGRVVHFLSKTERETPELRRAWADLMHRWIRPVTKSSADYRDLDLKLAKARVRETKPHDPYGEEKIPEHRTHNPEGVKRTRIPQAFSDTFKYVPKSAVDIDYEKERSKDQADSSFARLTQKMNRKGLNKR